MQTLDEFVKGTKEELDNFKKFWEENHKKHPEMWPMCFDDGDEEKWVEMFLIELLGK